jgi:hypothetical protein
MRMRHRLLMLLLAPITFLAGCKLYEAPIYQRVVTAPDAKALKVLFIGNSLTYYNDLAGLVQVFAAHEERPLYIDAVTFPLASLDWHWNHTAAREKIRQGAWDIVILQQYSTAPADDPASTVEGYAQFGREVARIGAKPLIFQNWTRANRQGDYDRMLNTYKQVQSAIGGRIAPIGEAWRIVRREHPEIKVFETLDDRHPTVAGTYLTACVLYRTLYNKPAMGLPAALPGLKLSPDVARTLQAVADQVQIDPAAQP